MERKAKQRGPSFSPKNHPGGFQKKQLIEKWKVGKTPHWTRHVLSLLSWSPVLPLALEWSWRHSLQNQEWSWDFPFAGAGVFLFCKWFSFCKLTVSHSESTYVTGPTDYSAAIATADCQVVDAIASRESRRIVFRVRSNALSSPHNLSPPKLR